MIRRILRDFRRRISVDVTFHVDIHLKVSSLTHFTLTVQVGSNWNRTDRWLRMREFLLDLQRTESFNVHSLPKPTRLFAKKKSHILVIKRERQDLPTKTFVNATIFVCHTTQLQLRTLEEYVSRQFEEVQIMSRDVPLVECDQRSEVERRLFAIRFSVWDILTSSEVRSLSLSTPTRWSHLERCRSEWLNLHRWLRLSLVDDSRTTGSPSSTFIQIADHRFTYWSRWGNGWDRCPWDSYRSVDLERNIGVRLLFFLVNISVTGQIANIIPIQGIED